MRRILVSVICALFLCWPVWGQTVEERANALIRELIKDPPIVIVEDEVTVGEPYGPGGPHADYQVKAKLKPGSPEYEAKVARLREKRRRDIQAKLVALGPPAVHVICRALTDQHLPYREYLAEVLAEIGDKRAVPYLIEYLAQGHSLQRMAETLAKQGNTEQARIEKQKADQIIGAAVYALEIITNASIGNDPPKWRAWWEQNKNRP